jgi:hypothetical protein
MERMIVNVLVCRSDDLNDIVDDYLLYLMVNAVESQLVENE